MTRKTWELWWDEGLPMLTEGVYKGAEVGQKVPEMGVLLGRYMVETAAQARYIARKLAEAEAMQPSIPVEPFKDDSKYAPPVLPPKPLEHGPSTPSPKPVKYERKCAVCGTAFAVNSPNALKTYCGVECRRANERARKKAKQKAVQAKTCAEKGCTNPPAPRTSSRGPAPWLCAGCRTKRKRQHEAAAKKEGD